MTPFALFVELLEGLERRYDRDRRLLAYRQRRHWKQADMPRLLALGVSPAAQKRMARMWKKPGRGVVADPKTLPTVIADCWQFLKGFSDPTVSPRERRALHKKLPTFPRLVEEAYRFELLAAQKDQPMRQQDRHGDRPSEVAVIKVAKAAGISHAEVRRLCQQVRDDQADWKRRGGSLVPDPGMSAEYLKKYLERRIPP